MPEEIPNNLLYRAMYGIP
jgi:large subunit ribosomal protein L13